MAKMKFSDVNVGLELRVNILNCKVNPHKVKVTGEIDPKTRTFYARIIEAPESLRAYEVNSVLQFSFDDEVIKG